MDAAIAGAGKNSRDEDWDAVRRTRLAAERTELAWWRTGLTSIAVAVGIGRIVPELSDKPTEWPYAVVGIGFAIYSICLIGYGSLRSQRVERAIERGETIPRSRTEARLLVAFGILLCLATIALIAAST